MSCTANDDDDDDGGGGGGGVELSYNNIFTREWLLFKQNSLQFPSLIAIACLIRNNYLTSVFLSPLNTNVF
jgi:hypothetical protein